MIDIFVSEDILALFQVPGKIVKEDLLALFRQAGALLDGHFVLRSGLHSR
jgi:hypothetical protein